MLLCSSVPLKMQNPAEDRLLLFYIKHVYKSVLYKMCTKCICAYSLKTIALSTLRRGFVVISVA